MHYCCRWTGTRQWNPVLNLCIYIFVCRKEKFESVKLLANHYLCRQMAMLRFHQSWCVALVAPLRIARVEHCLFVCLFCNFFFIFWHSMSSSNWWWWSCGRSCCILLVQKSGSRTRIRAISRMKNTSPKVVQFFCEFSSRLCLWIGAT